MSNNNKTLIDTGDPSLTLGMTLDLWSGRGKKWRFDKLMLKSAILSVNRHFFPLILKSSVSSRVTTRDLHDQADFLLLITHTH